MIELLQSASANGTLGWDVPLTKMTREGSLLIALCGCESTAETFSSLSETGSGFLRNNFTKLVNVASSGGDVEVWYLIPTQPMSSVGVIGTNFSFQKTAVIREYSGIWANGTTSGFIDNNQWASLGSSGANPSVSGGPGYEDYDLIVTVCTLKGTSPTLSAGSGFGNFASVTLTSSAVVGVEDKVSSSRQAVTGNFTSGGSGLTWGIIVAGFGINPTKTYGIQSPLSITSRS